MPRRPAPGGASGRPAAGTVLVRPETAYGYARASISTATARQALIAHEKAGTATRVKGSRPGIADTWTPAAPEAPVGEAPPADTPGAGTPGDEQPAPVTPDGTAEGQQAEAGHRHTPAQKSRTRDPPHDHQRQPSAPVKDQG